MAKKTNKKKPAAPKAPGGNEAAKAAAPAIDAAAKPAASGAKPAMDVSSRAHQIWLARGKPSPGNPLEDWLQAERELGIRRS